ncbi:LPXTG cell wall anchor domain-containing protein, partial [Streptococcus sp. zg-JUN1979]|uniref:LPXTG cell wall anchor domain-containing protein n=1 Tax=Streptococcus sp. zg-JUN1979 TaxID=3391450 RepID=UPI0039AFD35C
PSDNPPLPYIPGYEPKVPGTTEPLKPVDPEDPTKGYIPPPIVVPNNPGVDNPVPYEPIAPNVTETMMPEENKNSIQSLPETGDSNDMLAPTLGIVFLGLLGINLKKKKD